MTQTRLSAIVEAVINALVGYVISFAAQLVIYPAYGAHFSLMDNVHIGILFLMLSLLRSYVIRRWFDGMIHNTAVKLTKGEF